MTCPLLLTLAGVVLAVWGFTSHRRAAPAQRTAALRLLVDLAAAAAKILFLAALVFGPKRSHPRPKSRPGRSRGLS